MLLYSLPLLAVLLGVVLAGLLARRADLRATLRALEERRAARERGSARARLQYPEVDLSRCIGCGTCVRACPEESVLDLVHGQAMVIHGARCVGHGRCAEECPVGAIAVTLGDVRERDDLPAVDEELQAVGVPGLYLAGEVTGRALIRTAIRHGRLVAAAVARRLAGTAASGGGAGDGSLDLAIVGAGPAGLACALEARARGLRHLVLEQETLGGTVAKYPRRKLVMTRPVELPLHGRLSRSEYTREELLELWEDIVRRHEVPLRTGFRLVSVTRDGDGCFRLRESGGEEVRARNVCLALGRRGTPRKLGVPGEELPKVAYGLLDARGLAGRRVLVVGGGDSAVEAAVGIAEQPGTTVHLSYRRKAFFRLKPRNEARLGQAVARGRVQLLLESRVRRILPAAVEVEVGPPEDARVLTLENDEVLVLIGGEPPFPLLRSAGVSFDPELVAAATPAVDGGQGLLAAVAGALLLALAGAAWVAWWWDYYRLPPAERLAHGAHDLLRPGRSAGLAMGIGALACMAANLLYLLRRRGLPGFRFASLRAWLSLHVGTGLAALVLALIHSGLAPGDSIGGHSLLCLGLLVATGTVGRYLYAMVPHAANGRELALEEIQDRVGRASEAWDRTNPVFAEGVRETVRDLVQRARLGRTLPGRLWALVRQEGRLRRTLLQLSRQGRAEGIPAREVREVVRLARRAYREAFMARYFEDLRALLATWRWLHRWVALLVVLLVLIHAWVALRYGSILPGRAG